MLTTELIQLTTEAGITGAGLIFAAYSIIIAFSDKLKEFREKRIEKARDSIKNNQPVDKLRKAVEELEKMEGIPFYLSQFVYVIFLLYIVSSLSGLIYLAQLNTKEYLAKVSLYSFGAATILFGILGLSLLKDFIEFMQDFLCITRKNKKLKKVKNGL